MARSVPPSEPGPYARLRAVIAELDDDHLLSRRVVDRIAASVLAKIRREQDQARLDALRPQLWKDRER
jgi:hypothetical protein